MNDMTIIMKELLNQTISEIVCHHCRRYQRIYGEPPKVIALNSKLFGPLMMESTEETFCAEVIYFVASAKSIAIQPDREWIMLGDSNWKFKEFV